jgi:hypothetical protein
MFGVYLRRGFVAMTTLATGCVIPSTLGDNPTNSDFVKYTTKFRLNPNDIEDMLNPDSKLECIVVDSFVDLRTAEGGVDYIDVAHMVLERSANFHPTQQGDHIRTDCIMWVARLEESPALRPLIDAMSTLPALAPPGVQLSVPSNFQLAHFEKRDAKYIAHRDNKPASRVNLDDDSLWLSQPEQRHRFLTCVLYLTPPAPAPEWKCPTDGGGLRVYCGCDEDDDGGYSARCVVDVAPRSGRLVLFPSERLLHEVLPTRRSGRIALTAWLLKYPDSPS